MSEHLDDPFHLPRNVVPSRYDLTLEPDLAQATFTGSVVIALEVIEPVGVIWLNSAELEIVSAALDDGDGNRVGSPEVELRPDVERLRLGLDAPAPPGAYRLTLGFEGILNDQLHGFYRSVFKDDDGNEHTIATTQFESTDARRAFPCFDEPDFKAVFGITMIVPDGLFTVSNAPVLSETPDGLGRRRVSFADTMKMSTYLVAFVVAPSFEATEAVDVDGVPLRVVHPAGKGHLTEFALEVGAFSLRHFTEYYGIPYPGLKLDLVAVPDFAFGAMENLGCVTFREVLLLLDPQQATQPERVRIADTIAHEVAHMWFGDLVTFRWWSGIWLNEAFATFMGTMAVDAFSQWKRWDQFSLERSEALEVDALQSTRPIEYPVRSPSDAEGMFDILTYSKGGAVLRMLEQHLGEAPYRDGIRHYLNKHQYGNTETHDLWDAVEHVTGEPARRTMDSWIFKPGHPLLSVSGDAAGRLTLTQQRFCFTPLGDGDDSLWSIPVSLRFGLEGRVSDKRVLLESASLEIDLGHPFDWVVANAGGHGFYRVRYAPELLERIRPIVQQQLTAIERYGLVDDGWASALAGSGTAAEFLSLAQGLGEEGDLDVWNRLCDSLEELGRLLDGEAESRYQGVLRELFTPCLERLGWTPMPGDSARSLELRGLMIRSLAVAGQ